MKKIIYDSTLLSIYNDGKFKGFILFGTGYVKWTVGSVILILWFQKWNCGNWLSWHMSKPLRKQFNRIKSKLSF